MGKAFSVVAKIASPFVSIINPAIGVALAATAAASDVVVADRMRRKLNTEVDRRLNAQEQEALEEEEKRLQENLAVVKKLYNEHYVTLLHDQAMMEEYYLTIKVELERENVIIDNLPEVLELLDLCARGEGNKVIPKLEKYREQIGVLLRWGLMHIAVLAGEDVICREILKLSNNIIDCLEMDYLGHTILEYAHLLGNHQLVYDLKDSTRLLQQAKAIQSARLFLSQRKIPYWTENTPNLPDLGSYIDSHGNEETLLEALIIVGAFPKEPEHWEHLVFKIIELNKPNLLKKFLYHSYGCIRADFIAKIMQRYPEPRNYNQINSIDLIKGFGYLHQQGFKDFNEVHPISKLNPLETAIIAGEQQNFIKLLICGAKLSQRNLVGETPLMIAIRSKNFDVARHLVEVRRVDPRIYNHTVNAKALLPKEQLHLSMALKERIKEKQEQEQLQLKTFQSTVSGVGIDFIEQIWGYYNLWLSGQLSSDYARTPIVLGMYVLGIKQTLPFTEKELGWIASQLGLRCEFNGKEFGNKDGGLVKILAKDNGYIAEFEGKQVEAFEPEIQYSSTISNHFYAHLPTGTNKPDQNKYNQLKLYINNSALMLENFLTTQQKNSKLLIKNREFYQYAGYTRFEELSKSLALIAKPSDYNGENIHFNYCYYLPECDAGYQAIGVSRLTAAKLILDNLSDPEIFASIKVEWVHWVLSFYQLPEELSNISGLAEVLAMHNEAKLSLQSDPNNFRYLSQLEKSIKSLCLLASVGNCIEYLAKVVAAPHNHINALKYYQAEGQLNAGGVLVALAKLLKFNVRIWEEDEGGVNCIFDYIKDNRFATIDLLKLSKIDNQLDKVGLLSNNKNLNIKPVVTHIDLFRSIDPDSDLGAILHGWFIATNNKLGLLPENDLLVLLLKVKATLIGRTDYDYIRGAKHFRNILSKDLMEIFSEDFNNLDNLDSYWGEVADFRVRGYAREALLQEHCNLNASYKGQVSFLQHKLKSELEDKLSRVEQEHENLMKNFAANFKELENWQEQQAAQLQSASEQQKQAIRVAFQRQLEIEHSAVKKQAKKMMRGAIVNFVVNRIVAKIFPEKFPSITQGIVRGAVVNVSTSVLTGNKINLRGIAASSISYGISGGINLQEDLTKIAIRGMAEGLITGMVLDKSGKDIWQRSLFGAIQGVCDFSIKHHMKFSDSYTQEVFRGSVSGILEGVKNGETNIDMILISASEQIASNIQRLEEKLSLEKTKKLVIKKNVNTTSKGGDEASSSSSVDGKKVKGKQDEASSSISVGNKTDIKDRGKKPLFEQSTKSKQKETIDKYDLADNGEATAKQKLLFTIKKELEFQAFMAAQNGISFDIKQAFEHAKAKVNASSFDEIQNIQNVYDYTVHLKSQAQQTAVLRQVSMDREQPIEITSTKYDPESMEILQHTAAGQTFVEILKNSTQAGLNAAKKIPSVYTAWNQHQDKKLEELKQLYEEQALDFEAYLAEQQSKLLYTKCESLKDQFKTTDWRPLSVDSGIPSHTVGISKDKNGKYHYRDLGDGNFSTSALDKAKSDFNQGDIPNSAITAQTLEKLYDDITCKELNFGRMSTPGVETGGKAFICKQTTAEKPVNKDGINIGGFRGFTAGVNLASGTTSTSFGDSRLDVNAVSVDLGIGAEIKINKEQTKIDGTLKARITGPQVIGKIEFEKRCTESTCYQVTIKPYVGIGVGVEAGVGYKTQDDKKSTFTTSAGLGCLGILGLKLNVDAEPNQQNSSNNSISAPRPYL